MATVLQPSCNSTQDIATTDVQDVAAQGINHSLFGDKSFNAKFGRFMWFRDRHRFLDGVYNSYQNLDMISAKKLENISQRVGLSMEEVLSWFQDEKLRRRKLLASRQYQLQQSGHQFPPSPARTASPGSNSTGTLSISQFTSTLGTFPQLQGIFSTPPVLPPQRLLVPVSENRGRPTRHQSSTALDSPSPELKRQKTSIEYPCLDCRKSFAAERWSEHVKRVHFPDQVWECQKTNERTGKLCGSKLFFTQDNFETHLKGEHGCSDLEIPQLKVLCKFRVENFFHQICGFCSDLLVSRDESIEHIIHHFREISQRPNPPEDLGASEWKEKCNTVHKLKRGVHYHVSKIKNGDTSDKYRDRSGGDGLSQENPDNESHDNLSHQLDKSSNPDGDGGSAYDSNFCSSQTSSHTECSRYSTASSQIAPVQTPVTSAEQTEFQLYSIHLPPQSPTPSNYSVRSPSLMPHRSYGSQERSLDNGESHEKGRCPNPECGKVFKDLKAHMLTHQNVRPEKCPIATCTYHVKGFARKYDKNRHAITHYKGTMVCGFCRGSGTAAEKSFNRTDVFKRHLTSVHAVEQTPPNSRKKIPGDGNVGKKLAPHATGKCSTCSAIFQNARDFYEHLDDCVLRIVQEEDPSEAINAWRLSEVENEPAVHETLRNNGLLTNTINQYLVDENEEVEELGNADDNDFVLRGSKSCCPVTSKGSGVSPNSPVQDSRSGYGLTHPKGGVDLCAKGNKKRKNYPASWGCQIPQMKKRVMCAFDGQGQVWKDDMMLSTDCEVRIPLLDGKSYVTDLDV